MAEPPQPPVQDKWVGKFLQHLAGDRGASAYTQRNYRQAVGEFCRWHQEERKQPPNWETLQRDDFRAYLRVLGRQDLSRAAVQLRFSALRTFYRFLVRHGLVRVTPIRNLALPKVGKRIQSHHGLAKVRQVNVISGKLILELEDGSITDMPVNEYKPEMLVRQQ